MGRGRVATFAAVAVPWAYVALAACGETLTIGEDSGADAISDAAIDAPDLDATDAAPIVDAGPDAVIYFEGFEDLVPCKGFENISKVSQTSSPLAKSGARACQICPTAPDAGDAYMWISIPAPRGGGSYALRAAIRAPAPGEIAAKAWGIDLQAFPDASGDYLEHKVAGGNVPADYAPATVQVTTTGNVGRLRIYFHLYNGDPGCYIIDDLEVVYAP